MNSCASWITWRPTDKFLRIGVPTLTLVYCIIESSVSIVYGVKDASRSLTFAGIQAGVEVIVAIIVFVNLVLLQTNDFDSEIMGRGEKIARLLVGVLLLCLTISGQVLSFLFVLWHEKPERSVKAIVISIIESFFMSILFVLQRYAAKKLHNKLLKDEAMCSLACILMTLAVFTGSVVYRFRPDIWWVDNLTLNLICTVFCYKAIDQLHHAWHSDEHHHH